VESKSTDKTHQSVWNKEELPHQWKESIIVPVQKRVIKLTVIIIMGYHCYQPHATFYQLSSSQGYVRTYRPMTLFGITSVSFDVTGHY
jgi:hypothetical protein